MGVVRLSIIIITWNESNILRRCLESFYDEFNFEEDQIVVVDNGSKDDTLKMLRDFFPSVDVLSLAENMGVGPARNRGIMFSRGKYLMTLDNDTYFNKYYDIGKIVDNIFSEPNDIGVLGFKLLNNDGSFQQSCRRFPGWLQPIAARIPFTKKIGLFKNIQRTHMMEDIDFSQVSFPYEVDYVLGANQVFQRKTAANFYAYDEAIFFGPEDFDFCYRVAASNKKNYIFDDVEIVHDYTRRTRKFSIILLKHIMSYYYVMKKNKVKHL